jgi:AhpD family alkylhydroperoxidase
MHTERLSLSQASPDGYAAVRGVETYMKRSGLPATLIELVKIRASQINGCAFCLDMHIKDARKLGVTEQRLYLLDAWRESPVYTPAERAALAWTDALTLVAEKRAPDSDYTALREHFSDREIVDLSTLIGLINLWNRVAIGMLYSPDPDSAAAA